MHILLSLIIAIAVLLRILNLGHREFWYDEVLSLLLSTGQKPAYQPPQDLPVVLADYTALLNLPLQHSIHDSLETLKNLLRGLAGSEPHPPLFFLTQHLWLHLFGNEEAAMRSLGALLSVMAIGVAYGLGRYLLGQRGGLLLAGLLGTNPYYVFHSLNLRMYASLVFWAILSAWALLQLIDTHQLELKRQRFFTHNSQIFWYLVLIGAVAAGLMTFYFFIYWLIALAALVVLLDKQRWWIVGSGLGAGTLLTIPWVLWGTRQQLHNADLQRFSTSTSIVETGLQHLQDVVHTLGIHLILGDWISSLPPVSATVAGGVAILVLFACSLSLWQQNQRQILSIALLLSIFPLLLGLVVDSLSGKFTVGFGWGRSMIFILPGCLLLLATWIERASGRWQQPIAAALLLLYLSTSLTDLGTRQRRIFHQVADIIAQDSTTSTLIVMNSSAWGHVLRLAHYIPPTSQVMLIAQTSAQLAPALKKALSSKPPEYQRILWLDSADPVWSPPSTETERTQIRQTIERQFQLDKTQQLLGTMKLDQFIVHLYQLKTGLTHERYL